MKTKLLFYVIILVTLFATFPNFSKAQVIAGGYYHSITVCNDSLIKDWGYNSNGQLGNGTLINSKIPVNVVGLNGIKAITGGSYHSLALKNDGTVFAWGRNLSGELGNGTNTSSGVPVQVSGNCHLSNVI